MGVALNIAIIGGGLIGLSSADSLIHRGAKVTIFERGQDVGHGAGRYNSGMIHPSQSAPWFNDDMDINDIKTLIGWANNSRDLLMKRRQMLGCEDLHRMPGTLQLFESPYVGQKKKTFYTELGITCFEYSDAWSFGHYGLEFLEDQSGNAHHYCLKLAEDLRARGCQIRTHALAEIIQQDNQLFVKSAGQSLTFDRIIVAAGSASRGLLKPLNYELPVRPMQGHALIFARPDMPLPELPIMHWDSRSAMTVFDDHVRLSGTVGEDDPKALWSIWDNIAPDIVKALGIPLVEWSADRPYSEIGRPIIGATSIPHVWVNAGHGHMGWSLCTWSGEMLARMMIGEGLL